MNTTRNPYIGPRPFTKSEGHLFFGRDREARELSRLVSTEKLVLMYSQSGAGKSSLVNARLIAELKQKNFEVLPVGRVSGEAPAGLEVDNIYTFNLMRSLLDKDMDLSILARQSLSDLLGHLNNSGDGFFYDAMISTQTLGEAGIPPVRRLLIIDQFEELFTAHPEAWSRREDFFQQLSQAMQDDRFLWVLLVMREDYLASLDPFAHYLPGITRARYYMQRLERKGALEAIRKPVEHLRPYAEGVAERLVEDVLSIHVRKPDGSFDIQAGQYVEPIQLQIVCFNLWDSLPPDGNHITEKDIFAVADVNTSLQNYYAAVVQNVAQDHKVKERIIREWFDKELITAEGRRNMVLAVADGNSGKLSDEIVRALAQTYLVRVEFQAGNEFYELAHDRLVEPILGDNKRWFELNLSPLQRQATLWSSEGRNDSWLLNDQALEEVQQWAVEYPEEVSELESDFLEASRRRQAELEMTRRLAEETPRLVRRSRSYTLISVLLIGLSIIAIVFLFRRSSTQDSSVSLLLMFAVLLVGFVSGYLVGRNRSKTG